MIFDPKILQFDINSNREITFNYSPIEPYDIEIFDSSKGKFPMVK